jgi:hypothetical protein
MGFDQIYIAVKIGILLQSGASSAGALGFYRMYVFHVRVTQVQRELALHRLTNPDFTPQRPARLPILPRLNGGINVTRHIYHLCELFCNAPLCLGEGGGERHWKSNAVYLPAILIGLGPMLPIFLAAHIGRP